MNTIHNYFAYDTSFYMHPKPCANANHLYLNFKKKRLISNYYSILKIIELNVYQDNRILSIIKKWSVRNASFNKHLYNTEFSCLKYYCY